MGDSRLWSRRRWVEDAPQRLRLPERLRDQRGGLRVDPQRGRQAGAVRRVRPGGGRRDRGGAAAQQPWLAYPVAAAGRQPGAVCARRHRPQPLRRVRSRRRDLRLRPRVPRWLPGVRALPADAGAPSRRRPHPPEPARRSHRHAGPGGARLGVSDGAVHPARQPARRGDGDRRCLPGDGSAAARRRGPAAAHGRQEAARPAGPDLQHRPAARRRCLLRDRRPQRASDRGDVLRPALHRRLRSDRCCSASASAGSGCWPASP